MDRTDCAERDLPQALACVDLPAWPLQLLLRREPAWRPFPVAVVADDDPQAPILWVNAAARRRGILPGLRYASALSLAHDLRAGTVSDGELSTSVERLHRHLLRYSPNVEAARHEPGVFWLDARGLERLYGSLADWAGRLHGSLVRAGLVAAVAVGWSRFGCYGLARARRGVLLSESLEAELAQLRHVPLDRLQLDPRLRAPLDRLGVRTLGALCDLPEEGVGARFGTAARELHRLARGAAYDPLQPVRPPQPVAACETLEHPESDAWRLCFVIKRALHPLLDGLAGRLRAVAALHLELRLEDRAETSLREVLRPAAPTLDAVLLLELVRLRLERLELAAGVARVALTLDEAPASAESLDLFHRQRRRDPEAAARALARVRAELGDEAVVRAELTEARLPEAQARWVPLDGQSGWPPARRPADQRAGPPPASGPPTLVRRLLARPTPAAAPRSAFICGAPDHVSGGWWRREVRRLYTFVRTGRGELRWIFYDLRRACWRLQGRIE